MEAISAEAIAADEAASEPVDPAEDAAAAVLGLQPAEYARSISPRL